MTNRSPSSFLCARNSSSHDSSMSPLTVLMGGLNLNGAAPGVPLGGTSYLGTTLPPAPPHRQDIGGTHLAASNEETSSHSRQC